MSEPFQLRAFTGPEIIGLPDPIENDLLGPYVRRGARTIVVADTGHGKTTLVAQLIAAILTGGEALGHQATQPSGREALIVDLEQGLRTIKRLLRESGLDGRDDLLYVTCPDGLDLGSNDDHLNELHRIIEAHWPSVVALDPFYKAHRGDANEERPVVDLMRILDALRAKFGFALLMPAHPRKDVSSNGARKLTLHDVAGSGAITRGAEIVLGLERLSHGYARLRILKDRDGDLPVGEAFPLIFERGQGFRLDPKEERTAEDLEQRILDDTTSGWRTSKEWAGELGIQHMKAKRLLEALAETGRVLTCVGPQGRSPRAHCYMTAPTAPEQSGAVDPSLLDAATAPLLPTSIGDVGAGAVNGSDHISGAVDPDDHWLDELGRTEEALQRERAETGL